MNNFSFAFAYSNIESQTITNCLQKIFYLFGAPGYVDSNQEKSLFQMKLYCLRIPTSKTSVYNPRSNSQSKI